MGLLLRAALLAVFVCQVPALTIDPQPRVAPERAVFQTKFGDLVFSFHPELAPKTVPHILALIKSGSYNSNHFFRVDKGFVAQIADVSSGRLVPLSAEQQEHAKKTVPLEVVSGTHHTLGTLSMARSSDPNSGGSSFSVLLGSAPHLDMQYSIFGQLVTGHSALDAMQLLETKTEGIFVMPKDRVSIFSTFVYYVADPQAPLAWTMNPCEVDEPEAATLQLQVQELNKALQAAREKCLPSA